MKEVVCGLLSLLSSSQKSQRMLAQAVSTFQSPKKAVWAILRSFVRHGFDGSGDDGGSCIDGRLTRQVVRMPCKLLCCQQALQIEPNSLCQCFSWCGDFVVAPPTAHGIGVRRSKRRTFTHCFCWEDSPVLTGTGDRRDAAPSGQCFSNTPVTKTGSGLRGGDVGSVQVLHHFQ